MEKVAIEAFFVLFSGEAITTGIGCFLASSHYRGILLFTTLPHVSIWFYATSVAATHINVRLGCYCVSVCAFCLETGSAHG